MDIRDVVIILLGLFLAGVLLQGKAVEDERIWQRCLVERIVDGDTVVCTGSDRRVRLLGYDAPEMHTLAGRLARADMMRLAPKGTMLVLWRYPAETSRDIYGRDLWHAYLDVTWTMGRASDKRRWQTEGGP